MSNLIDEYLEQLSAADQKILQDLRQRIHAEIPGLEECISYNLPAFKLKGKVIAGFYRYTNHFSYFPFSGSVLAELKDEIKDFKHTKSSLHFTSEQNIPQDLLRKLLETRKKEAGI